MNIYFVLLFVGVGFYYIVKSANLPTKPSASTVEYLDSLRLPEDARRHYTRYLSLYYMLIGILLIIVPFLYMALGNTVAYIVGIIFILGAVFLSNKKNKLLQAHNKTSK